MPAARATCLVASLLALASLSAAASAAAPAAREPFFPHAGDPGIDALHYDVSLSYRPSSGRLRATTTIRARSNRPRLRSFRLDLVGLRVRRVAVDGQPARFNRALRKLVVHPDQPLALGPFEVEVAYEGRPRRVTDPDGSSEGWIRTPDGAFGVGEPQGTPAWIPCNDVPRDKATYSFSVNVPRRLAAVANGSLESVEHGGGRTTYEWREPNRMSSYLAVVDISGGKLERGRLAGLPSWTLVDPALARKSKGSLAQLGKIVRFESSIYGPYPFDATGAIVDDAPDLGYALETQSRPIYAFAPDLTTVVHETAHQWFGDSVSLRRWPDIWLNEGFATWTEWYYAERHGRRTAAQIFHKLLRVPASDSDFWNPPPGRPGEAKNLFATSTYVRGAMTLEALREKVGTKPMLKTLRRWATERRHRTGNIGEFEALAEGVSGRRLGPLFQRWLYRRGKP